MKITNKDNEIQVHKTFSTLEKSIRKLALLREMTPLFPLCDVHKSLKTLKDALKDKTESFIVQASRSLVHAGNSGF